jgi:hypothetical protein
MVNLLVCFALKITGRGKDTRRKSGELRRVFLIDGKSPTLRQKLGGWSEALNVAEWKNAIYVDSDGPSKVYLRQKDSTYEFLQQCLAGG